MTSSTGKPIVLYGRGRHLFLVGASSSLTYEDRAAQVASTQRITKSASLDAHRAARYDELFGIYRDAVAVLTDITLRLTRFQDESAGKASS